MTRSSLAAAGLGIGAFIGIGILGVVPGLARFLPTGLGDPARQLALGLPGAESLTPLVATVTLISAGAGLA